MGRELQQSFEVRKRGGRILVDVHLNHAQCESGLGVSGLAAHEFFQVPRSFVGVPQGAVDHGEVVAGFALVRREL